MQIESILGKRTISPTQVCSKAERRPVLPCGGSEIDPQRGSGYEGGMLSRRDRSYLRFFMVEANSSGCQARGNRARLPQACRDAQGRRSRRGNEEQDKVPLTISTSARTRSIPPPPEVVKARDPASQLPWASPCLCQLSRPIYSIIFHSKVFPFGH